MAVAEQDIKALTPHHRIVWHSPPGQPVEMGLYVDEYGDLRTDVGHAVLYKSGMQTLAPSRIVRIIPPALVPRAGMVIGKPGYSTRMLVRLEGVSWLGSAPEVDEDAQWFTDDEACYLVEDHGWEVVGDLAAPSEVTDAEVEAAAGALADHYEAGSAGWSPWANEARAALEAAREVRNG